MNDDDEMPEIDWSKAVRRDPRRDRRLVLPLAEMRTAAGRTQADIATALDSDQPEVSRLERRPLDRIQLATLRRYAEALGGRCEISFVFDTTGHRIVLGEPK